MEHGEKLFIFIRTIKNLRHFKHHLHFGTTFRSLLVKGLFVFGLAMILVHVKSIMSHLIARVSWKVSTAVERLAVRDTSCKNRTFMSDICLLT